MTTSFIPPPPRVNLVDGKGKITRPWSDWLLNEVVRRIGGTTALTNLELAELLEDHAQAPFTLAEDLREQNLIPPTIGFQGADDLRPTPIVFPCCDDLSPHSIDVLNVDDPNGRIQAIEAQMALMAQQINDLQQSYQI